MYSTIALSPVESDMERCSVVRRSCPGTFAVTIVKGSFSRVLTASATVAKLSSTYWPQMDIAIPGLLPSNFGYCDSTSHNTLATRPFSFIPSVVETSYPEAITLPYFEVHCAERGPACPLRRIPRGNIHRLVCTSSFQSMDR